MNFAQYIFETSKTLNDKIVIFHREKNYSYSTLYSFILKIISKLNSLNLEDNEKIIIIADNSFFSIASYFGIIGSGRIALPIHPDFGKDNFLYIIKSCKVKCGFIQKKYIKRINTYALNFDIIFSDEDGENLINIFNLENMEGILKDVVNKNDLAIIIFTSGSTGFPKGVMLSHYNLIFNTESIIQYLNLTSSDRIMVVLPFSYCFGLSLLHTHLKVGGQIVLNNMFMFPGKVLNEINEKKCTNFAGVPSVYSILLRKSPLKKMKFPTLRLIQQAGGKLSNTYILELKETLPNTKIFIMYGQTEATARISYLTPELLLSKLGSIGKGIPGTSIDVLNESGNKVKPGEVGEIVASGANIMLGYWEDPEETSKVIKNGRLYTGDLGTVDEDGFVFITDRIKDMIKVGGYRVGPKEIEDWISALEDIVEVAVIGIQDDLLGEAIKVYASTIENSKITKEEIIKYCQRHFPPHKMPKEVEFIKEIPKNISSKIDKIQLKNIEKQKRENIL